MSVSVHSLPPTPLPDNDRLRRAREWFDRLRAEGSADLPAFAPTPIDDANLTEAQRHAVSRAVATPDVCLIETDPTNGRLLAAAVAKHAAQRGERVLLIAPESDIYQFETDFPSAVQSRPIETPQRSWFSKLISAIFGSGGKSASASTKPTRVLDGVSLHTPEALVGDPRTWDRLVVFGTCEIERPLLCGLCARADRWVFVGHGMADHGDSPNSVAATWRALAPETWVRENERLCCRLRQLTVTQRKQLTSEPVADSPDIELRIYQPDGAAPELAEVVFPSATTLIAAKEFLARQLDEWPIDLDIAEIAWSEDSSRVVACSGCPGKHEPVDVEMNPGVRELVADCPGHDVPWSTCGVQFDRAAGWDRSKAEVWIQRHCAGKTRRAVTV